MFKAKRAIYGNEKGHHDYFFMKTQFTIHLALGKKINFSKIPCKQEFKLLKRFYKVKNILTTGFALKFIILSSSLFPSLLSLPLHIFVYVNWWTIFLSYPLDWFWELKGFHKTLISKHSDLVYAGISPSDTAWVAFKILGTVREQSILLD